MKRCTFWSSVLTKKVNFQSPQIKDGRRTSCCKLLYHTMVLVDQFDAFLTSYKFVSLSLTFHLRIRTEQNELTFSWSKVNFFPLKDDVYGSR